MCGRLHFLAQIQVTTQAVFGNYIIIIKISRIICKNIYSIDLKLKKERVAQKRLNRATLCHDQREVSHDEKIISYITNRYNLYKTL